MSLDFNLEDPVTRETIRLPIKHLMYGGTLHAELNPATGRLDPAPTSEAWLNVTYNYCKFYFEAAEGDDDFYGERLTPGKVENCGIRALDGKTGAQSLQMLYRLIERIERKYPNAETSSDYWEATPGNALQPLHQLAAMASLRPDGIWRVS